MIGHMWAIQVSVDNINHLLDHFSNVLPSLGVTRTATVTGIARLDNVKDLLVDVIKNNIEGGYIGKEATYSIY